VKKIPPDAWLQGHIDSLLRVSAGRPAPPDGFPARSWTWLKLAILNDYIPVYLRILKRIYPRLVYVDLFGGSGLSPYRDSKTQATAPGSSLVAASFNRFGPGSGFHRIFSIEKEPNRARSLAGYLAVAGYTPGETSTVLTGDSNVLVDEVLAELEPRGTHALIFADPEGMDLHLQTLKEICAKHDGVDLFVTHLVTGAGRHLNDVRSPKLSATYGGTEWNECRSRKDLTELYTRKLEGVRDIVFPMTIRGDFDSSGYTYDLFFAVRETPTGSEWAKAVESLKPKVESLTGTDVERVLQTRVRSFSAAGRAGKQRTLGEEAGPRRGGTDSTPSPPVSGPP
jgi:three-Cys-motif partner protein